MFKPLWQHGRAICFADGWFEWKKEGDKTAFIFIHRADGQPVFMAAIGSTPFERGDEAEGFLIVTAAADRSGRYSSPPAGSVARSLTGMDAARDWQRSIRNCYQRRQQPVHRHSVSRAVKSKPWRGVNHNRFDNVRLLINNTASVKKFIRAKVDALPHARHKKPSFHAHNYALIIS